MLKDYKKYTYNVSFVYTQPEPVQTWIYQPQPILRPICPFSNITCSHRSILKVPGSKKRQHQKKSSLLWNEFLPFKVYTER